MAPGVLVSPVQPSFGPGYNVAAGMNSAPSLAQAGGQSPANATFLTTFTSQIRPRLTQVLAHFGGQDVAKNLVLAQIWTYLPVLTENKQILKAEEVCLMGAPELQEFHSRCCHEGVSLNHLGPMGKVWESGVVQVVQNAENLSTESHPCNKLNSGIAKGIGEIVYMPVYDVSPGSTTKGVVAVIELLMSARSQDVMVVANVISTISAIMETMQLTLSQQSVPALQQSNLPNKQQKQPQQAAGLGKIHENEAMSQLVRHSAPPSIGQAAAGDIDASGQNWAGASSYQPRSSGFAGIARTPSLATLPHA